MDLHMPGLNGLEATDSMRAFEKASGRCRTPIVALTASAMPTELGECMRHDMDAVLSKPFVFDAIQEMLLRWSIIGPAR
jgi:CheY-like chemotaxis protein